MMLELMIKVPDFDTMLGEEASEERELNKLLKGEEAPSIERIPTMYEPYVLDLNEVKTFGRDGEEHTKIVTQTVIFFAKIEYEIFTRVFQSGTGKVVKTLNDFKIV